ncbi:hypothetical protein RMCBS344292_00428 [Rhizopus microsporus]|nr:hypothetical protein RMCBS344292_00428 [Rhizopus microsporus]
MDNSQFRAPAMTQPPPGSHQHLYGAHNVPPQFTQQDQPTIRSQPAQPLTHSSAPQHNADQLANSISNINIHSDSQRAGRSRRAYAPIPPTPRVPPQPSNNYNSPPIAQVNQQTPLGLPPQTKKPRIDPNLLPSPVELQVRDADRCERPDYYYGTCTEEAPPLASTNFKCIDQGNCNPRFMRPTLRDIPSDSNLVQDTGLPFGIIIQPLAQLHPEDANVPLIPLSTDGPVRCSRCKGYINPWCQYIDAGRKFICNLCEFTNIVPEHQFCPVDIVSGRRMDMDQHPELMHGSVEFQVPEEYWLGVQPRPLHYMFAIDVSRNATGMLHQFCGAIKEMISSNCFQPGTKLGIMTFDNSLHFYNLQSTSDTANMMVVPDPEDVFIPLLEGLFVDPYENVINKLLDQIPNMFQSNPVSTAAFGSAARAALLALDRNDTSLYGRETEKSLFTPQGNFYTKMGNELVEAGVSVDIWLAPPANYYIDVATVGVLSALTAGEIHYLPNFDISFKQMYHNLRHTVQAEHGYRAKLRVRCSNGITTADHYGNFSMDTATDIDLAGIQADTAIGVELTHDGSKLTKDVYIQSAMLYTTSNGERRLRVHNLKLAVGTTVASVFKGADADTCLNLLTKKFITLSIKKSLSDLSNELDQLCVKVLLNYRKYVTPQASPAQLVLPETVKTLPLLISSFKKSILLRKDSSINADTRVYTMRRIKSAGIRETIRWFYPQMIKVHEWLMQSDKTRYPLERLSYEKMDPKGIYWIETYGSIFLWLGKETPSELINLAGVSDSAMANPIDVLQENNHPLWNLYNRSMGSHCTCLPKFQIIRQGLDLEIELAKVLVEDEVYSQMSYPDYLCELHRQIKLEVK